VEKVKMLCGVPLSRRKNIGEFFLTQEDYYLPQQRIKPARFFFFLYYIFLSSIYREISHYTREKSGVRERERENSCFMDLRHFKKRLFMVAARRGHTLIVVHIHSLMLEKAISFC
jgi:hypothetical protein